MTEPELEPTNLSETVVRGAGMAGAGYVLGQILTLGFYLVLARIASPQDFGEFAAGSLLVTVGLLLSESGMMAAVIQRRDRVEEAASTAVVATASAGLGFGLLALAASPLMGLFFDSDTVGEVAAATSGLLVLRSLMIVPEALLQRQFSFLRRLIIEPAGVIAFGVAAVIACSNGMGVWGLVIGYYCAAIIDVSLSWGLVRWRPKLRLASVAMWRELIRYGRFVLASVAIMRLGEQIPVALIGRTVGTNPLGQYRYADRMGATPLALIVQAAAYVIFPAMSRIAVNRERLRGASLRSLRLMCAVAFPLGLLLVPLGVPAAVTLFGEVWRDAGKAAMLLAGFPIGATLISFASEVVKADGRPDIQARIHVVTVTSSAALMGALLPFGLFGVCAGISLGSIAGGSYALRRVGGLLDIPAREMLREVWPPALAAALMAGLLVPVELLVDASSHATGAAVMLLAGEGLAGIAVFAAALRVASARTFGDLTSTIGQLGSMVARLIRRESAESDTAASGSGTPR
jgi:O-antigen/teichoic acid export membrane protein